MNITENTKLIVCIMAKGVAGELQRSLIDEWQLHPNIHYGRGIGRAAPLAKRGIGEQQEKEILEVIVDASMADAVFEYAFYFLDLDKKPAGLIYMMDQQKSTLFELPDLDTEK
jgi:hypothetical protein